jgi:hypothetical protein
LSDAVYEYHVLYNAMITVIRMPLIIAIYDALKGPFEDSGALPESLASPNVLFASFRKMRDHIAHGDETPARFRLTHADTTCLSHAHGTPATAFLLLFNARQIDSNE